MNIPVVDENLYGRTLGRIDTPYDIRQRQPNNQNNRGQKPNIPPQKCSLPTNCTLTTPDITTKPQGYRNMSMNWTFRQVSSPKTDLAT